jgi:hypothetical protein
MLCEKIMNTNINDGVGVGDREGGAANVFGANQPARVDHCLGFQYLGFYHLKIL